MSREDTDTVMRYSEQLAERVLVPLVLGGELRPLPPFGARRARALSSRLYLVESDLKDRLWSARLAFARGLCPLDALPDMSPEHWSLVLALNDLLQVTHPHLNRSFGKDPQFRLLKMVDQTIDFGGAPATLAEALERHTTFARIFELVRCDEHVTWWTGSRSFRGERAPARLSAWPRLRRVEVRRETVTLGELASPEPWAGRWLESVARWVKASPLTDLATASRKLPEFGWSGATLGLVSAAPGRTLALRALDRQGDLAGAVSALRRGAQEIEEPIAARRCASAFADELEELHRVRQNAS